MRRSASAVTSLDVARAAGVSQSAVSRAYTPGASIAPETRDHILAVAQALGYNPRPALRTGSGNALPAVAIVMADITNPFYPEVLEAFALRLREHDLVAQLYCVPRGVEVDTVIPELFHHRVAGVVVTSATLSSDLARTCRERRLPVVLFNRSVPSSDVTSVACDNYAGGRQVAELLLRSGHDRIAFLAGREDTSTNRERERGLRDGLAAENREVFAREVGFYTYERALDATRRLMALKRRPDAIFCANDIMALAAIDVVSREAGLRIPDDVSIVGFDDIAMAAWPAYRLTTVRQRVEVMIDETIELLHRLMANPESAGVTRLITGTLIERATARPSTPPQLLENGTYRARKS